MSKKKWAGTKRCELLKDIKSEVSKMEALSAEEKRNITQSLNKLIRLLCPV